MKKADLGNCMDCGIDLRNKKMYPAYSARLAVVGYRCADCHEKSKSPAAKKREEEMSLLIRDVPKPENVKHDLRKALEENNEENPPA